MNTSRKFTVLVTGLGALGTVFAALLKKAGHTVYALTKEKYLSALADRRLRVTGIWGEHAAAIDGVYGSVGALTDKRFDLILITVKSYDTTTAIGEVKPLIGEDTLVVSAQNGYGNYETIASAIGRKHSLLARIIFGVKVNSPGNAEVTVIADDVRIGQPEGAVDPTRISEIAGAFSAAGIPTQYAENVEAILWDKILYNASLNPLGAILECTYGQLADNPDSHRIMDAIIEEIFLVARAHGKPLNWKTADAYRSHFYTRLVPPTAKHFPSMYYDVKAGKRLEIDALNGAIVALAHEINIPVPVNEMITGLLKAKEALVAQARTRTS